MNSKKFNVLAQEIRETISEYTIIEDRLNVLLSKIHEETFTKKQIDILLEDSEGYLSLEDLV